MSYVFIKISPKPNPNIEELLDPNSAFMKGVKRETALAMAAGEMYMTLKRAYEHAVNFPELYMDEHGSITLPWGEAARQLFTRIDPDNAVNSNTL